MADPECDYDPKIVNIVIFVAYIILQTSFVLGTKQVMSREDSEKNVFLKSYTNNYLNTVL